MASNTIGKVPVRLQDMASTEAVLKKQVDQAQIATEKAEWNAGLSMGERGHGEEWSRATRMGWGRDETLLRLVMDVEPQASGPLLEAWSEKRHLGSVVASFQALCTSLAAAEDRVDRALARPGRSLQLETRLQMQASVDAVEKAIAAAGPEAVVKVPLQQLGLIKSNLAEQVRALERKGVDAPARTLAAKEVATLEQSVAALARLLDAPKLIEQLPAAAQRAANPKQFGQQLGALAMLIDQASGAPDYATTGAGWHHPNTRVGYRERRQQAQVLYVAEGRRLGSQQAVAALVKQLVKAEQPGPVLEQGLVQRFLAEIGASGPGAAWKPSAKGVTQALQHELLLPLRALNETIEAMDRRHPDHRADFEKAVHDISQAVVEGRYPEWRNSHPLSQKQLSVLSPGDRPLWTTANTSVETQGVHGGKLKSREEDGLDLFWLTKIGGPSHGFDYGGHCLLPLLANARTRAIVVEDEKWPEHPAGRAYLRLLSTPDGKPLLYLEPTQRDFAHREVFKDGAIGDQYAQLLLEHAVQKARLLGLPLSIDPGLEAAARRLGAQGEFQQAPVYELKASAGVLEASDTLTHLHDWPQTADQLVNPVPRFLVAAEGK